MTEESATILRGDKNANIINEISRRYNVSLKDATDIFYKSETAAMIEDGTADLQCRSDIYLAQCVWEEHLGK